MEKHILIDDNVIKRSSDPIIAAKSVGSFVKIDAISIDLADADDDNRNAGKCEHFSIRGYVSEVRKKNWKICWPFALDGDLDKPDQEKTDMLPPLDAPKFKLWCCQNCLREIGSKNVAKGHGTDFSCHVGSNSKCTSAQMPPATDTALIQSDYQQGPKSKAVEEKQFHAYTYSIVNGSVTHPSLLINKKQRNGEALPPTIIANENSLANWASHEMPRYNSAETEVNTSRMQERHSHVTEKLDCNGSVRVCKPGCESHEDASLELEITKDNCWIRNCSQNGETECHSFAQNTQKESVNASGLCNAPVVGEAGNSAKVQTNVCRPLILDESDYASSENHEKSSGFHRKKSRKVRLLTELLCNKEDAKTDYTRPEDSPSIMIDNSAEVGSVAQGQVSLQENVRVGAGENKKRKLSDEEEKGDQQISHPKLLSKKVKTFRRDAETGNAIAGTGLEEDALARVSLAADIKKNWSNGNERMHTVGRKKAKKSHDLDAWSSLTPTSENVAIESQDRFGNSSKNATNAASFRLRYDPSTDKGSDLQSSKKDRKSGVKRKGKMPESATGQASLSNTRKDAEFKPNGQGAVQFNLAEHASTKKGLDLSLNNYLATQRYDGNCLPQKEDAFPSLATWKDSTCKLDQFMRKNVEVNYLANSNKPSTSMANPLSEDGVHGEPSKNVYTYSMPILNEKQSYSSLVEQGSCSLMQQMDISHGSKNQKIIDVEKNSVVPVSRKHSNHQAEVSEKGTIDDIPMEIVELMAKNQYERCLHETRSEKHALETPSIARNAQIMEHTQVYGIGDLRILEETSQKRKAPARNAKNGTTKKNVAPVPQKSVDYFSYINGNHFGVSRFDQMQITSGFGPFSQSQKKPSPRGQFPAAGNNSKCSCAQSCKWDGSMMGHGFSNSNLQSFATCNTCQSVPQPQEEAAHLWSPVISAHMPFAYKNFQKSAAQSSNVKMLSHSSVPLHGSANGDCDLSLNLNAPNFEKRNEAVGSETVSRTNPEYSFNCKRNGTEAHEKSTGSLDLYSNETIPAMHLLSLMDAGMRSGTSLNMGGNPKFPKRPFPNDLNSKGYPGLAIGLYKAADTVNHPSTNCYGKNLSEKSLDLFPTNPTFGASTSSFEQSKGFGRETDFMGQVLSSQKKEKIQRSHTLAQNRCPRSQKPLATDGGFGNNHTTIPVHSIPKGFLPVSGPSMFPPRYHTTANSRKHNLEAPNANGTMQPPKISLGSSICCINRNPADFSIPDVGNGYMIRAEDLRVRKKISPVKRHGLFKVDQQKRQRNTKYTIEKDRARH